MSDTLIPETPETSLVAEAPGDAEAVAEESAGAAAANMVEAERFNGLMSAHQRALKALEDERNARIALETRYQQEETTDVTDDNAALAEVRELRAELAEQRLATAKAEALARHPGALPFADLIQGGTAAEIEGVAAAIAERMAAVLGGTTTPIPDAEADAEADEDEEVAPVVVSVPGGATPPGAPIDQSEALKAALASGDWNAYWAAKSTPEATHNLA
jgi:hypothetical protein